MSVPATVVGNHRWMILPFVTQPKLQKRIVVSQKQRKRFVMIGIEPRMRVASDQRRAIEIAWELSVNGADEMKHYSGLFLVDRPDDNRSKHICC